ncbi:hypothetical protein [Carnobacterium mobile]
MKNWDYAELSKDASNHGGPEKYVNYLMNISEKKGLEKGIAAGVAITTLTGIGIIYGSAKLKSYMKNRKTEKIKSSVIKDKLIEELQIDTEENEFKLMKKYGIEIYGKDNTIAGNSRSNWAEWFNSEEERNKKYQFYTTKRTISPNDMLIEMEIASSPYIGGDEKLTRIYTKIEKDIQIFI